MAAAAAVVASPLLRRKRPQRRRCLSRKENPLAFEAEASLLARGTNSHASAGSGSLDTSGGKGRKTGYLRKDGTKAFANPFEFE